jgi:hypothetical protein
MKLPHLLQPLVPIIAAVVMLAGGWPAATAAGQTPSAEGHPLDLAAMALAPRDLQAAGLDGYGIGIGETIFTDGMVEELVTTRGIEPGAARALLDESGFVRWHLASLLAPDPSGDPSGPAGRMVITAIMEFEDAQGAAGAWATLEDESFDPAAQDIALTRSFGTEAEATRTRGTSPDGAPYTELDLTLLDDTLHIGVVLIDWTGGEPRLGDAEALAATALTRVRDARAVTAPGLGSQVLRLDGAGIEPHADYYTIRDGEPRARYRMTPFEIAAQAVYYDGATDVYHLFQQLAARGEGPDDDSWYLLQLVRFPDATTAAAWFSGRDDYIGGHPEFTGFTIDAGAPRVGDESFAYAVASQDGTSHYRGVVLRVDSMVAVLDVYGPEVPPPEPVMTLAQGQAACMAKSCVAPLAVPAGLAGPPS